MISLASLIDCAHNFCLILEQALFWMSSKENLSNDPSSHSIHPLWEEYSFPKDGGVDIEKKFYFNPYTVRG